MRHRRSLAVRIVIASTIILVAGRSVLGYPMPRPCAHPAQSDQSGANLFERGREAFSQQNYEQAIALWRQVLQVDPENPAALEAIGAARLQLKQFDQAIEAFATAAKIRPLPVSALVRMGRAYLGQGQTLERLGHEVAASFKNASGVLEKAQGADPTNVEIMQLLGIAYFKLENHAAAAYSLERAVDAWPDDWQSQFWLARSCTALGSYDEAFDHFEKAMKLNPDEWTVNYWHGQAYFQYGNKLDAQGRGQWQPYRVGLTLLNESRRLRPNRTLWLFTQGVTWLGRGDTDGAIRSLSVAVKEAPQNWQYHLWLGAAFHKAEKFDQAIKHLELAVSLGADNQGSHIVILADSFHKTKQYDKVISLLDPVCQSGSLNWLDHYFLGRARTEMGQRELAIKSLSTAIQHGADGDIAFHWLGVNYCQLGHYGEAVGFLRKAISRNANRWANYGWLAKAYDGLEMTDEAIASYRRALELNPDHGYMHFSLGTVYRKIGKLAMALEEFKQAVDLEPNRELFLHWLGTTYSKMGLQLDAIKYLDKAASLKADLFRNHDWLGYAYFTLQDFEKAKHHLERAHQIRSNNANTIQRLIITYNKLGEHDRARRLSENVKNASG